MPTNGLLKIEKKKKKKVTVEVYSLIFCAKRYLPDFHPIIPWSQDLSTHKPSKLPGEHTARLPFPAHRNY